MARDGKAETAGISWENWSGSLRFQASRFESPRDEGEVLALVRRAAGQGRKVRPVGAGHSSSALVETDDTLISLDRLDRILAVDPDTGVADVEPGATLKDLFASLRAMGLSPHDLGDISMQRLGGALATGTHGSGRGLGALATMLVGGRLVTGAGDILEFDADTDADLLRAARVHLGALGVFTRLRIKLERAYRLRRTEWCADVASTLSHLDELFERHRKFDFYWYPRSDAVKLRLLDTLDKETPDLAWARMTESDEDWADRIIPKHSSIENRFEEMEYALPAAAGPDCFRAVRKRILERHRREVGWRVLYREVAEDDADLSTAHGRHSVDISIHHNAGLPWQAFFADMEPVFLEFGGRPHWAKKHSLKADRLSGLYPRWQAFVGTRRRLDPDDVFLSPYLAGLLEGAK